MTAANAFTIERRFRCTRCRRLQAYADVCGLCGGTLFIAIELPAPLVRPVRQAQKSALQKPSSTPPPSPSSAPEIASERRLVAPVATLPDVDDGDDDAPSPSPSPIARVSLADVAAERVERIACDWGGIDDVLGGGFPLSSVVLLGGDRGTGKSRFMLAVAARIAAAAKRPALYCSTEGQRPGELAAMVPRELDARPIQTCCSRRCEDVMRHACELDAALVVIDSVQELEVEHVRSESDEHARYLMTLFDELARASRACIICISQMSGMGRLRGSQKYQQLCDTIGELVRVNDQDEPDAEAGQRIRFGMRGKNRGGPTHVRAFFRFDRFGALRPETSAQREERE